MPLTVNKNYFGDMLIHVFLKFFQVFHTEEDICCMGLLDVGKAASCMLCF